MKYKQTELIKLHFSAQSPNEERDKRETAVHSQLFVHG
jgi:hypothetical protein